MSNQHYREIFYSTVDNTSSVCVCVSGTRDPQNFYRPHLLELALTMSPVDNDFRVSQIISAHYSFVCNRFDDKIKQNRFSISSSREEEKKPDDGPNRTGRKMYGTRK